MLCRGHVVGQGSTRKAVYPNAPADDSYWIVFLDANNPTSKVQEFVVPGQSNAAVPSGVDAYMSSPAYVFAVAVAQNPAHSWDVITRQFDDLIVRLAKATEVTDQRT